MTDLTIAQIPATNLQRVSYAIDMLECAFADFEEARFTICVYPEDDAETVVAKEEALANYANEYVARRAEIEAMCLRGLAAQ